MITADQINKILDKAEKLWYTSEKQELGMAFYLGKALVYAIIYATESISAGLRNR